MTTNDLDVVEEQSLISSGIADDKGDLTGDFSSLFPSSCPFICNQ